MVSIKEAQQITGITSQNIRYYEKEGLLTPARKAENSYREFSFMPDDRCDTPEEFSRELLKYARENNQNMVITREGMAPDLMINGVEYHAYRTSSRFGIVVHCKMIHQEDYFPQGMTEEKYRKYRALSLSALPVLIFIMMSLSMFWRNGAANAVTWLMILLFGIMLIADMCFIYYCYGRNFR